MKKVTVAILLVFLITLGVVWGVGFSSYFNDDLLIHQNLFVGESNLLSSAKLSSSGGFFAGRTTDNKEHTSWRGFRRKGSSITADLGTAKDFNTVVLKEKGMNIQEFTLEVSANGTDWKEIYRSDKIEPYRLSTFDSVSAQYIRLTIEDSQRLPAITDFELYAIDKVVRNDPFRVTAYMSVGHIYNAIEQEGGLTPELRDEIFQTEYFDTVTDVFFIFDIRWDENGVISYDRGKDLFAETLREFKAMIGDRDVNIFVTLLNPHDNGKVMSAITDNRETLLTNMIDFVNEHGLDGIDLDWEFPFTQEEFDAYNSFLRELKHRLVTEVKPDAQLSLALATWALMYEQETIDIIDQVQVMGYDILDQDGEHASFYGGMVQPLQYILSQGFTKEQINLGFPFYGTYKEGRMEQYIYNQMDPSLWDYWNNWYPVEGVGDVYYNSPAMLKDKTAYAMYTDVGGVMIFSLYCDVPYSNPLSLTRSLTEIIDSRLDVLN